MQQIWSYIATAVTTGALAISAFLYINHRPQAPPTKIMEKFMAPYKDLIAKTTELAKETKSTIEIQTLEDLAKIAEILARPILYARNGDTHMFFVIENDTKYLFKCKLT